MAMIFFMQTGFVLLENGSVRAKNTNSILIKNLFDACYGAITFWLVGFGFVTGDHGKLHIIGIEADHFLSFQFEDVEEDLYLQFIFQFSFAATAATIVSGALAERVNLKAYMIFSVLVNSIIYPMVAAWIWNDGWLNWKGFHDFAGAGAVHLLGGTAAFVGAKILGPRYENKGKAIKNPK